jgi:four helix bundle protein
MRDFEKLEVWQKAHQFVLDLYDATRSFPGEEQYGLTSQIRRAATSVPSNISEGCGRGSDDDLARFMQMSAGSASEVEYQLRLANDLGYLDESGYEQFRDDIQEIQRMLHSFIDSLRD